MMIAFALLQHENALEFLIFELIVYLGFSYLLRNKHQTKKPTRYKYEDIKEEIQQKETPSEANQVYFTQMIKQANAENEARAERITSYDFREFKGRKNVNWEEVENYLFIHCKYKGVQMWSEYISELIKQGVLCSEDREKIFSKHKRYYSINPRPDLEAKEEQDREKWRVYCYTQDRRHKQERDTWEKDPSFNYTKDGNTINIIKQINDDLGGHFNYKTDSSEEMLKTYFYDEYLKRKGLL